jgi:peptidoglycan/LPS O-acetylase OafA/YrhL
MIQRIQSVWLLLAATLGGLLFAIPFYNEQTPAARPLYAQNHYSLLFAALLATCIPLVAIFLFKNRRAQVWLAVLSILANIAFIGVAVWLSGEMSTHYVPPVTGAFSLGAVLPIFAIVALILAARAIRKDQKMIRSADRLR